MTFKTILAFCDTDRAIAQRLSIAVDLATRFESHLVGFHVRQPFQPPVYVDSGFAMDALYKSYEDILEADEKASMAAFTAATEGRNIAVERETRDGVVADMVAKRARCADLLVVGQASQDTPVATPPDLPESVALASGRPVLVVPYIEVKRPIGRKILVCWNDSREAARAAADALPFLKGAERVTVLAIRTDTEKSGAIEAAEWLRHHGVKANVIEEAAGEVDVGDLILSQAADLDADLIVMGAYGHARVRELILGGASRTLLRSMTVPVFMAH